ncbi:MAG: DNA pilot protein [Microviridae sp.]|nr:MAG: DNA pilot protein [Microviridae sp.]
MPLPVIGAGLGSVIGAGIGAAGSLFSGKQSSDFAEKAYKHRYQWQVQDLKKAGLNPMISLGSPAPNVPQPNFPNLGEAAMKGASYGSSAAMQAKIGEAQLTNLAFDSDLKNNQAQVAANTARSIDMDNELKTYQLPYGADSARLNMEKLNADAINAGHIAQNSGLENILKSQDVEFSRLDREQKQALAQIEIKYRGYMAEQARLGINEKAADSKFWDQAGVSGVWVQRLKQLLK